MVHNGTFPWRRIAAMAGAMAGVLLLAALVRMLISHGVFTPVSPAMPDGARCVPVAGVTGPEDIVIDSTDGIAIISATDRRAFRAGRPSPADGLYAFAYTQAGAKPVKIAGTPVDFHPHGISLYRAPNGAMTLYAINHRKGDQHAVMTFALTVKDGRVSLTETGFIGSDLLISPNAIAAVDESRFYLVNDHGTKSATGRWLDDNLVLPRADVLYFDGTKFTRVARGLNFPSGIVVSADGQFVYVSESYPRKLLSFNRDPFFGRLQPAGEQTIASNLDNLRLGSDGGLWIGSHPKAYALAGYRTDASKPAPSAIYRVGLKGGEMQPAERVLTDDGGLISASSVAAFAGGHLLVGAAYDTKILNCRLR